jgi:hypothetical protein
MLGIVSSLLRQISPNSTNHNRTQKTGRGLPVVISLLDPKTRAIVKHPYPSITGYLRDINRKGLSLVMPSINCGDPFYVCSSHILLVTLKFQNRDINIEAFPVRYNIDERQGEYKYLIGARILQINRSDRKYIDQYLRSSRRSENIARAIINHLHAAIFSRIRIRRSGMHLPLNLSISEIKVRVGQPSSTTTHGYLNDISKTGLSVIIPALRFGGRYPVGDNYRLRIQIQLPSKLISIEATPIRYNKLEETEDGNRYLIGARITEMNASDRKDLIRYIKRVKKRKITASQTTFAHDGEPL